MGLGLFALIVVSVSLNALAQVALRKAMLLTPLLPGVGEPLHLALALASNVWLWAGMGCYALSIGLWLMVLARVPVSVAYPMLAMGYVLAATVGFYVLNEAVPLARWGGILLICIGVLVVARTA